MSYFSHSLLSDEIQHVPGGMAVDILLIHFREESSTSVKVQFKTQWVHLHI